MRYGNVKLKLYFGINLNLEPRVSRVFTFSILLLGRWMAFLISSFKFSDALIFAKQTEGKTKSV